MEVSRKRWFGDYVVRLLGIQQSSVDVVFSLPESVDIPSLELDSLQEFFQEHQVLRILLNGVCIFKLQLQQVFRYCLCDSHCVYCAFRVPFSDQEKETIGVSLSEPCPSIGHILPYQVH